MRCEVLGLAGVTRSAWRRRGVDIVAYVSPNFRTKKQLKEALAAGRRVSVFEPGLGSVPDNGKISLEGPHYPQPHTWYAEGTMKDGVLVKVR